MVRPAPQGGQAATFNTSNHIPPSAQKIAPSIQRIARNIDPNHFNQRLQGATQHRTQQADYPQGFYDISDASTYDMLPHPGYQGTQNYNGNNQANQNQQG